MPGPKKETVRTTTPAGKKRNFSAKRQKGVALLVAGHTRKEVADLVGCPLATVDTWLRDPEVRAEIDAAKGTSVEKAKEVLVSKAQEAAHVIIGVLSDPTVDPKLRLSAATQLLDRIGLGPNKKVEQQVTTTTVPQVQWHLPANARIPGTQGSPISPIRVEPPETEYEEMPESTDLLKARLDSSPVEDS